MTESKKPVLIVGAGPTGLTAAAILTRLGIPVRIIDKNAARSTLSKALGVHAGTLECLERAFDSELPKKLIAAGHLAHEANIHLNDQEPIVINLRTIPSAYNHILILPQSETERLLEEKLNSLSIQVERNTELLSLQDFDDQIVSKIKNSRGEIEEFTSPFVIGADGAKSETRISSGISFEGLTYSGDFILGDVTVAWPWEFGSVRTLVNKRGIIAAFPLGGDKCRLILIPPTPPPTRDREISIEEFRQIVAEISLQKIEVKSATWLTRFNVHHRMVKNFQKGRVFLAGDAAHIHSPAGGQGMNTGIQDALNLGFKLKKFYAGKISFAGLSVYEKERLPIAKEILNGTDFATNLALSNHSILKNWMKYQALPFLLSIPFVQKKAVETISQVKIGHQEIARYE